MVNLALLINDCQPYINTFILPAILYTNNLEECLLLHASSAPSTLSSVRTAAMNFTGR